MLNHLITIFNVFGYEASMRMLDFKIQEPSYWSSIKTMLLYLGYVDESWNTEIPVNDELAQKLREL